jgi:hypothetical protein
MKISAASVLVCATTLVVPTTVRAQSGPSGPVSPGSQITAEPQQGAADDPRWSVWLGCWTPAATTRADGNVQVCIVPAGDGHGVRMLTFTGDTETLDETFVADGMPRPQPEPDCTGERATRWSTRGDRWFAKSTLRCAGQPELKTSSIAALIGADRWIEVQVAEGAEGQKVRIRRFWRSSTAPPAPLATVVPALAPARHMPLPPTADDVIDASRNVPALGVEAWLAESDARIQIDRRTLLQLSDARVDANVIDLMVALAFPKKFEVRRTSTSGGGGFGVSPFDGYFGSEWSTLAELYGFGYSCYAWPYCWGYGGYYPPGDWYLDPGAGGGGGGESPDTSHGVAVNGRGYTRIQPREPEHGASGRTAGSSSSSSDSSGGSSSSGSGSASPAGYSGGGGASTGLTAVPR